MAKYVRVQNNEVVECMDYIPENSVGDWREAIEIEPILTIGRQIKGPHSFNILTNPVQITWSIIDVDVLFRKHMLMEELNLTSFNLVQAELIKEFDGQYSDFALVQQEINIYRTKRQEIIDLQTHEQIDLYLGI
jgi:hypothetical protein